MSETVLNPDFSPDVYSYRKDSVEKGKSVKIECVDILGQTHAISRGPVNVVGLEDEWYEDQRDPETVIKILREQKDFRADLFTFWQRPPHDRPSYDFPMERVEIALLPIQSYDHWWKNQIKSRIRGLIRKTEKEGVTVRETVFDDDFARALTRIFNESPNRQGRKFWHYGKDFETVKRQFSRYLNREVMIAAYYEDEIVGLIMLGDTGRFGLTGQIITSLAHRDKAINNALIAKAVEICEERGLGHLCYFFWSDDSLSEFKRRCGFEIVSVPRYYVPLTWRGRMALKIGLHRGWKSMIPPRLKASLKSLRWRLNG